MLYSMGLCYSVLTVVTHQMARHQWHVGADHIVLCTLIA